MAKIGELLAGEVTVASHRRMTLTNVRIWQDDGDETWTAMLEDVSFCAIQYHARPERLFIAVCLAIVAFVCFNLPFSAQTRALPGLFSMVAALVFGFLYLHSRRSSLKIAVNSGETIVIDLIGKNSDKARDFICALQNAKNARFLAGSARPAS